MADLTRGGLIKPTDGEDADIDVLNSNSDKLGDYAMGFFICTSTTRPAQPWSGLRIYETDTKAFGYWDVLANEWMMVDTIWQTYTPIWGVTTGTTALGNSTFVGKYARRGKLIDFNIHLQIGSSGVSGGTSGGWTFSLPFSNRSGVRSFANGHMEISGSYFAPIAGSITGGSAVIGSMAEGRNLLGPAYTLGNGSTIGFAGTYERA